MLLKSVNRPDEDVTVVMHDCLPKIESGPYYIDVIAIHPKSSPGNTSSAASKQFQSSFHKNFAAAKIWKFLAKDKTANVSLRDLFLPEVVPDNRRLVTLAIQLKSSKDILKFRVVN